MLIRHGRHGSLVALAAGGALAAALTTATARADESATLAEAHIVVACDTAQADCRSQQAAVDRADAEAHALIAEWLARYDDIDGVLAELQDLTRELGLESGLDGLFADLGLPQRAGSADKLLGALAGWSLLGGRGTGDARADMKAMLAGLTAAHDEPRFSGRMGIAEQSGGGGSGLYWMTSEEDGQSWLGFVKGGDGGPVGVDIGGAVAPGPGGETHLGFEPQVITGGDDGSGDDGGDDPGDDNPDGGTPDNGVDGGTPADGGSDPGDYSDGGSNPGGTDGGSDPGGTDGGSGGPDDVGGLGDSGGSGDDPGTAVARPVNCAGTGDCGDEPLVLDPYAGDGGATDPAPEDTGTPTLSGGTVSIPGSGFTDPVRDQFDDRTLGEPHDPDGGYTDPVWEP